MLKRLLTFTIALPMITACAAFHASAEPRVTPQQTAVVEAICATVDRLQKGTVQWAACTESLSKFAVQQTENAQLNQAYQECAQQGLKNDKVAFSTCVVNRENGPAAASSMDVAYVKPADSDPSSYFSASFDLRRHREKYSCALMGLEPGTGGFGSCVADLDMNLFYSGIPNG